MPPPPQHRQREHHGSAHPGVQLETAARLVMPAKPRRGAGLARAGQGEGDQRVAGRGAGSAMAAGGDQDAFVTPASACWINVCAVTEGMTKISYAGYRFPSEVINQAIWLYLRFTLSFRDVEDLLAERGIAVS
jgi:hypothetical protein